MKETIIAVLLIFVVFMGGLAVGNLLASSELTVLNSDLTEYVIVVDDNQYDTVTATSFIVDESGTLIFKKNNENISSYACGYWTRVFDKRKANIEKEEVTSEPVVFEVINKEEETNVDQGVSP